MGVYIKDIEIPKEDELIYLVIRNDGIVECVKSIAGSRDGEEPTTLIEIEKAKAIYIPEPHDRLIDANMLYASIAKDTYLLTDESNSRDYGMFLIDIRKKIDEAPTVIEGSE